MTWAYDCNKANIQALNQTIKIPLPETFRNSTNPKFHNTDLCQFFLTQKNPWAKQKSYQIKIADYQFRK